MTEAMSNRHLGPVGQCCDGDAETIGPKDAARSLSVGLAFGGVACAAVALVVFGVLFKPQGASAVPSFAMQTGQPCSTCHTAFPELTPFGRRFKINGYTMGGGIKVPPLAAMLTPAFTHTDRNQDTPPAPNTYSNNNTILQQGSVFYGGQIYGNLGALVQVTYDWVAEQAFLDNSDVRYADTTKLFGTDLVWGIDTNNNPTLSDPWNTTPAWSFPYLVSTVAPQFGPPGPLIGSLGGTVIGTGAYTFWKDMLYVEVSAYQNLSSGTLALLGDLNSTSIVGAAPYWRVAFEPTFGDSTLMIGTFGMQTNEIPIRSQPGSGVDQILDIGFDSEYQYISDKHAVTAMLTYIIENQHYNASINQGLASNQNDNLNTFNASIGYVYDNTYSFKAAYFNVAGSSDALLYSASSITNSPNSSGLIFDAAYLPFSHGAPGPFPWVNARIGMSYTKYLTLFGGTTNFDGAGHNAADNNTLLLYSWVAF